MNRKQRRETAATSGGTAFVEAFNQGLELQRAGLLDQAAVHYRKAMALNSRSGMLLNNFSVLLYNQGNMVEAEQLQRRAIQCDPNNGMAYNNLGVTLNALHKHAEAIPFFKRGVALQPGNSRPVNNLGDSLVKSGHFEEGIAHLKKALQLDPLYAEAHSNHGMALWGMGQLDDAIGSIRHAIQLEPTLFQARKNLGIVLLMKGDFAEGWSEYEHRPLNDPAIPRNYTIPRWKGQPLGPNEKLLVWSEQGVGDEILYANMMRDVKARGVNVLWEADPRLIPLFKRSSPDTEFFSRVIPPILNFSPDVVAQVPVASLGQYLRPSAAHFPRGSYLTADTARGKAYREQLGLAPGEKLVGMSWLSKNVAFGANKSTTLSDWAEIFGIPGLKFVNLQYGDTRAERDKLKKKFGVELLTIDDLDLREDLDGVAALTAACDLVVTVSNTTAHIAGALGVQTWVMVPVGVGKFWYWGFNTDVTPWYPTASIIRQEVQMDWNPTLQRVADRLRTFAGS